MIAIVAVNAEFEQTRFIGGTLQIVQDREPKTLSLREVMKQSGCIQHTKLNQMNRWLNTPEGLAFADTYPSDIFISRVDDPHYK